MSIGVFAQSPVFTSPDIRYDVSTGIYAGSAAELDVSTEEPFPFSAQYNGDGTKLFILGKESTLIQYNFSVAYDHSTSTYAGLTKEFYVGNELSNPRSFEFNDNGSKVFVVGGTDRSIHEYQLSSAYSVSTATHSGSSEVLDLSSEITNAYDLAFNDSGSLLFVLDFDGKKVVEYTLTTAFDVSTASHSGVAEEFSISNEEAEPLGMAFSGTGDQLFITGRDRSIVTYNLGTAFDISTGVYAGATEELVIGEGENYPHDLVFDNSGLQLAVVAATNDAVFSYNLTHTLTFDENATEDILDIDADDGQGGATDVSITYSLEGDDANLFEISATGVLTFKRSPDHENPTDADLDNIYDLVVVAAGLTFSTGLYVRIEVQDVPDTPIFDNDFFDVSTGIYKGFPQDFSVANEDNSPFGFAFNDDGSKMFVLGNQSDAIITYDLSTAYDVSTASYAGVAAEFSVTNEETSPFGFTFNADGSKLFVVGLTDQAINSYSLSIPYDLSTANYDGASTELYVGNEESEPSDLTFNNDGTRLFIIGNADNSVIEYHLTSSYEINTATYAGVNEELLIEGEENPYGLSFNNNGSRLFVVGGSQERIMEYYLPEPYDISTAIYSGDNQALSTSSQDNEPVDVAFHGNTVYVLGAANAKVYEYELGAVVSYIENQTRVILDVQANDGMGGVADLGVSYSLTGADASLFAIDATGNLTFIKAPDFETALDEGSNNIYEFNVVADNGINKSKLPFKVRVDVKYSPFIGQELSKVKLDI